MQLLLDFPQHSDSLLLRDIRLQLVTPVHDALKVLLLVHRSLDYALSDLFDDLVHRVAERLQRLVGYLIWLVQVEIGEYRLGQTVSLQPGYDAGVRGVDDADDLSWTEAVQLDDAGGSSLGEGVGLVVASIAQHAGVHFWVHQLDGRHGIEEAE